MVPEQSLTLTASDGVRIRSAIRHPDGARRSAVLCHPHPEYGGTMDAEMIVVLSKRLADAGVATVRFDFRRPGTPEERLLDVRAAIDEAASAGPVLLAGWSFGAKMALAAASDDRVRGVVSIAAPLQMLAPQELEAARSALLLVPEHDQYAPPPRVRDRLPDVSFEVIEGTDHFLSGHEEAIANRVLQYDKEIA